MIMTYDWMIYAQNHPPFKKQIEDLIASGNDGELTSRDMHRIKFEAGTQTVVVTPYSKTSDFHRKIIPKRISYRAILQIINGNWNDLREVDIQDV